MNTRLAGFLLALAISAHAATLTIVHFAVGNGDSTLISFVDAEPLTLPDRRRLSEQRGTVINGLRQQKVTTLDFVVATHRDPEHSRGLKRVLKVVPVSGKGGVYDWDITWQAANGIPPFLPGWRVTRGEFEILCVAVNGSTMHWHHRNPQADENSNSAAFRVKFGKFTYFIGGDLTGGGQAGRAATPDIESHVAGEVGEVAVLRVNHHGSETSSNSLFLAALNPAVAIISTGQSTANDQLFQWPSPAVLDRLIKSPSLQAIYVTGDASTEGGLSSDDQKKVKAKQGNLIITTTGSGTFQVNGTAFNLPK